MDNPNFDLFRESFEGDSFESSETHHESEREELTKEGDDSNDESSDSDGELGLDDTTTSNDSDGSSSNTESSETAENNETDGISDTNGTSSGLLPTSETSDDVDSGDTNGTSTTTGATNPSTKSNDSGSSGTTAEPEPAPDTLTYCEKGALSCYTFDQISNDYIYDYDPLNMSLQLNSGASLDSWDLQTEFLQSFLVVTDSTLIYRPSQPWPFSNNTAGIDVWFSVDNVSVSDFTLAQIGNYLQISYDDFGRLSCSTWEENTKITASIQFFLDSYRPHHVSCRVNDGQLFLRVLTFESSTVVSPLPEALIKVWVANNPLEESSARFNGHIHALRIWDDLTHMRKAIEEEDFTILLLGE